MVNRNRQKCLDLIAPGTDRSTRGKALLWTTSSTRLLKHVKHVNDRELFVVGTNDATGHWCFHVKLKASNPIAVSGNIGESSIPLARYGKGRLNTDQDVAFISLMFEWK